MHQPIYWPAPLPGAIRVQRAAESYDWKRAGGGLYPGSTIPHPQNNLASGDIGAYDPVFSNPDRINAYQHGPRDSLARLTHYADAGASVSYSGSLMDNVQSWGEGARFDYRREWRAPWREARSWRTSGGLPRMDFTGITYHHALAPLLPPEVLRWELRLHKAAWREALGINSAKNTDGPSGFFPPELAFSQELIPLLRAEGFNWSMIAANHLGRATANYLEVAPRPSSSSWNTTPPNKADLVNAAVPANRWWSGTLDGRGATLPAPFANLPHRARHIDPSTGAVSEIVVVPADDVLSYMDGYSPMGTDLIENKIARWADPARPPLVLLTHDGDNAFAGGWSYYHEAVPNLARAAAEKNYAVSTVEQYLARYPVPAGDVVHVEDGGWINPEGDWGDPQFVKWLYPPARSRRDPGFVAGDGRTYIDIEKGFSASWRSWAVIMAGANIAQSAEQSLGQALRLAQLRSPDAQANRAELAWHYYLSGLDSGFMYYGSSLDDEVKSSLALNNAWNAAEPLLSKTFNDRTPPTLLRPQRWPWNPGGMGWGVTTGYRPVGFNGQPPFSSDFYVWTLAFDVSGLNELKLWVRDAGPEALRTPANFTYARGSEQGEWHALAMTCRVLDPTYRGDPADPSLDFFILPQKIAQHCFAKVTGERRKFLDYYVEARDAHNNVQRTGLQRVWVE